MKRMLLPAAVLALASAGAGAAAPKPDYLPAWRTITGADLARHVAVLASDEFGGRAPGTPGEELTLAYLEGAFRRAGAAPYRPEGYRQDVPLVEVTPAGDGRLTLADRRGRWTPAPREEFVVRAGRPVAAIDLADVPLVFAGFGVTAPEDAWDDYAGSDVAGGAVLLLRGEPGAPADSSLFLGRALTTHALSTTKSRNAARHGARLAVVVHTDSSAGYPWSVLTGGGLGTTQMFLAEDGPDEGVEGVVHVREAAARKLLARAGLDLDALVAEARRPGFRARPLGTKVALTWRAKTRAITSHNVIARIEGREAPDECVIYTAHWDHVGTNPALAGDRIFNGAIDNATGTAGLLELAEAFAALPERPRRTVLLVATTSEEKGLLGSEYLSRHPVVPLARTVAVLNMDALFPFGSYRAMAVPGLGSSEVEDVLAEAARRVDRVLVDDSAPEAGAYYRSDHFPFAEKGVPAVFAVGNPREEDLAADSMLTKRFTDYLAHGYHKPTDEYDAATWDLRGIEEDVRVFFETGVLLANDRRFPNWRYANPFRALRDAMREASGPSLRGSASAAAP